MSEKNDTNRLANETSPYLQQHAHNPVDWFPWGEEALRKAQQEDKPVLLSIGYSSCHWCHVMARESFENAQIAEIMNKYFVNIKVDREERPDLDSIYQSAVQIFGQSGGWPLTIFLTPDQEPFYGGTYFPPENRHGQPGFSNVLLSVFQFYKNDKEKLGEGLESIREAFEQIYRTRKIRSVELQPELLSAAGEKLKGIFDPVHGGFGTQPKFPNTLGLQFFLRMARRKGDSQYREMALLALRKMAEGGIYDQLGGGFHRYSVDERWLVPHFEKMLYDNALIAQCCLEAYQLVPAPWLQTTIQETLDFVLREMTSEEGGFYTSLDADSENGEGSFYLWNRQEVLDALGEEPGLLVCEYYGISEQGNLEGQRSVLSRCSGPEALCKQFGLSREDVESILRRGRQKLLEIRKSRPRPFLDRKIITSWNGLMIRSLVAGMRVLGYTRYLEAARSAAEFVLQELYRGTRLLRCTCEGKARLNGFLDDYVFFIAALLDLYELTGERRYLDHAVAFADDVHQQFWDDRNGGFYLTGRSHERLVQRPKQAHDQSLPSGVSVQVQNLLRLFSLTERVDFREPAGQILRIYQKDMEENPFEFSNMLSSLDMFIEGLREVVVVGQPEDPAMQEIMQKIRRVYQPNMVLLVLDPKRPLPENSPDLLRNKVQVEGKPTVYVCRNFICSDPATVWEEIEPRISQPFV